MSMLSNCCKKRKRFPVYEQVFLTLCQNSALAKDEKTLKRLELVWDSAEGVN